MARYGQEFKDKAVARLLPPESAPLKEVALAVGVSESTLERWRSEVLAQPGRRKEWTPAARFEAVLATAAMDEAGKSAWCRGNGVYPHELAVWREQAINGLAGPGEKPLTAAEAKQDRRRIKELEREIRRKDKALAEAAALLVLSKWRRSSTRARTNDRTRRSPDDCPRYRTGLSCWRPPGAGLRCRWPFARCSASELETDWRLATAVPRPRVPCRATR